MQTLGRFQRPHNWSTFREIVRYFFGGGAFTIFLLRQFFRTILEEPAGEGLLGPALRVTGHIRSREPVFASSAANSQLPGMQEQSFLLYPFANQGAIRGEYRVFMDYAPVD